MMTVLINAYAVSPDWGSEQGVGWNWITSIARYCKVHVITESEYKDKIEAALISLPQKDNIYFYYLSVSDRVRRMCWNQGDYRFYFHYAKWQKRALILARQIIAEHKIDVIHMLNMVGYREPGYLWKIKGIPYVWGPMAGAGMIPLTYFRSSSINIRAKYAIKNAVNYLQFNYSCRVRAAINHSSAIITPVKEMADLLKKRYGKDSFFIPETGLDRVVRNHQEYINTDQIQLLWVGRFIPSKKLDIALRTLASVRDNKKYKLHIIGFGTKREEEYYKALSCDLGVSDLCVWHGKQPNDCVQSMMRSCDILFFTSIMEVTSTVLPEAISNCLPILCHNTCGFGPLVSDTVGWTIPLQNPDESVKTFASVLDEISSSDVPVRLQKVSFDELASSLTFESKAHQVLEIYNKVVNEF